MCCRLAELLLRQRDELSSEEASSTGTPSYTDSDPYELTGHQYDNNSTRSSMSSPGSVDDDRE